MRAFPAKTPAGVFFLQSHYPEFRDSGYNENMPAIAENKRAHFDYAIAKTYEAGLELFGFEVKGDKDPPRQSGRSYVIVRNDEGVLDKRRHSALPAEKHPRRLRPQTFAASAFAARR